MASNYKKMKLSELDNLQTFQDYINRLSLLALTVFEWEGLPPSLNARYLEKTLFYNGKILFFEDDMRGLMCLKCTGTGELNFYDEPISFVTTAIGYNETYSATDSVLMRDNYLESIPYNTIMQFAYRLANAERTIDINIHAQKTPILILTNDSQKLTMANVYAKWDGFEPVIHGNKDSLEENSIKVLKTDAPYVADKLQNYKHQLMNEALTFIGINNANTDKKERLITSEVDSNDDNIDLSILSRLMTRQQACKLINEKYGTNISVKIRELEVKEVLTNEPVHNGDKGNSK